MSYKYVNFAAARLATLVFGFAFQILVVKSLEPSEYAYLVLLMASAIVLAALGSLGLPRAISRFVPEYLAQRNHKSMLTFMSAFLLSRAAVLFLFVFVALLFFREMIVDGQNLSSGGLYLIIGWLCITLIQNDIEALCQACFRYNLWSTSSLLELVVRVAGTSVLISMGYATAIDIIALWAATSLVLTITVPLIGLLTTYWGRSEAVRDSFDHGGKTHAARAVFLYSMGMYVSSCAWLASSSASTRLAAASGLSITAIAALSFTQNLVMSAQRALPMLLLMPAVEPLIVRTKVLGDSTRGFRLLGIIAKSETVIVLCAIVFITPLSPVVVSVLSKSEFSIYSYLIPVLLAQALASSYFRVLEVIASVSLKQTVLVCVAAFSIIPLCLIFLTTKKMGISALIIWPSVDLAFKLVVCWIALRKRGASIAIDLSVLAALVASTALFVTLGHFATLALGAGVPTRFAVALATTAGFCASLVFIRPIRAEELAVVTESSKATTAIRSILGRFSRPSRRSINIRNAAPSS